MAGVFRLRASFEIGKRPPGTAKLARELPCTPKPVQPMTESDAAALTVWMAAQSGSGRQSRTSAAR